MVQFRAFFYKLTETNVLVTQLYKIDTQKLPAVTCTTENPNRVGRGITPPPSHTTRLALAPGGFF